MIKYFTDYRTQENNIKITELVGTQITELEDLFRLIEEWRSVDNAEGIVLDELGQQYGQLRKGMTDEVYRLIIKSRILANNSKGDIYSVIEIISSVLRIDDGKFDVQEVYLEDDRLAGLIDVTEVPMEVLLESGLTGEEFRELIKATLAAGVGIRKLTTIMNTEPATSYIGAYTLGGNIIETFPRPIEDIHTETTMTIGASTGMQSSNTTVGGR